MPKNQKKTPPSPQAGIVSRPTEHALVAAVSFVGASSSDPTIARTTVERLRELVHAELRSDLDQQDPTTPKDVPGPETGELGFADDYDRAHLTITLGLSQSGFARLGVAQTDQPQDLVAIDWSKLSDPPALTPQQGDLILQICSDDLYVCEHVLRRMEEQLGDHLSTVWVQLGAQRYTSRQGRTSRKEGRALLGFTDGTANLDPRHEVADAELVFVDPAKVPGLPPLPAAQPAGYSGAEAFPPDLRPCPTSEPDWTCAGTYMVVRASVQDISAWDDAALGLQEGTIGRFKFSGAFLDLEDNPDHSGAPPAFASDQSKETVAVDSHARKANPRRPEDRAREIFRRGFPLIAANRSGSLERGLLFICFARTISAQFEFIWRAWMKNPNFPRQGAGVDRLLQFDHALCGGYYFVPALSHPNQPWTWVLPYDSGLASQSPPSGTRGVTT